MNRLNDNRPAFNNIITISVLFAFSAIGYFLIKTGFFKISAAKFFYAMKQGLLMPKDNAFVTGGVLDVTSLTFIYIIILAAAGLVLTYYAYFIDPKQRKDNPSLASSMVCVGLIGFMVFSGLQQYERMKFTAIERYHLGGQSQDMRVVRMFGKKQHFVESLERMHQGSCATRFMSDENYDERAAYERLFLRYALLPRFYESHGDAKCVIMNSTTDGPKVFPQGYTTHMTMNQGKYLLAVKDEAIQP